MVPPVKALATQHAARDDAAAEAGKASGNVSNACDKDLRATQREREVEILDTSGHRESKIETLDTSGDSDFDVIDQTISP